MKFKLKKVVCLLCTIIVLVTAFSIPVSANSSAEPIFVMENGTKIMHIQDIESLNAFTESMFIDSLNTYIGYDVSEYYYFINLGFYRNDRFTADIGIFPKDNGLTDNTLFIQNEYISTESYISKKDSLQGSFFIRSNGLEYINYNLNLYFSSANSNDDNCKVLISNIPNISYNGENVKEEEKSVIPFTVSYTPELGDNMKNVIYYPSKGGANADENGLVEQQVYTLDLNVTLTEEFLNLLNKYPNDMNNCTYEFIVYITTTPPESVGYSESAKKAIYTDVHYGDYMYTTSGVVSDFTDDYNEPTNWIKAQGANIGYIIPQGTKSKSVNIRLENVDTSKLEKNQQLYCVVYGRLTGMAYPTPDYFNIANQESLCKGELNSTITYVIEDDDDDPNNNQEVILPDYYCATSEPFYFGEYPEYTPKRLENGSFYDTNKGVFAYTDKNLTPDKMWDNDMVAKGEDGLSPDDFKVYEDNKKLSENYQSFNFDTTDLKSIFTEGTDFFKFLTTSISILPSYFMTILISFFTVFLAIVLIKFVF